MQVISLSVVVLCLSLGTSTLYETNDKDVVIFRGERDRFTNVFGCSESNAAVCSDENCTYCQCMVDQTFIQTKGQYGKCVLNELIVYATSYEDSFPLQNYLHKFCLYEKPTGTYTFVRESTECSDNSLWIWTNFGQLLNWQTLECMTDDYYALGINFVTMKKCDRNNQKQLWECEVGGKIKQTQSGRYINYGEYGIYVTTNLYYALKWTRFGSEKDVCSQAVGCETFTDSSSLIILNKTKCEEQSECLGEKEIRLSKTKCFLLPNKTQYLHNDTWKALEIKNGSFAITVDKVSLQWDLSKTPESWGGLLVEVQFKCEDTGAAAVGWTEHCVVIKYTGTFKGFHDDGDDDDGDDNDGDNGGDDNYGDDNGGDGNDGGDKTNKDKTDADQKSNGSDKDNTQIIIITVCVLVVLLLTGVIVFIIYRYRNRHGRIRSKKGYRENQDQNQSSILAESVVPLNLVQPSARNQTTQTESQQYEVPCERPYEYVDKTAVAPPQTFTYDYAYAYDRQLKNDQEASVQPNKIEGGDYVIENDAGDTSYISVIEPRPDTEKEDAHDDYVVRDKSYITVVG